MDKNRPHVLITAGNTREYIDSVRWWSNIFTGRTGLDIAIALRAIADVTLLTSNTEHLRHIEAAGPACGISAALFESHADLMKFIPDYLAKTQFDAVFMTAAVSDYAPDGTYAIMSRESALESNREIWMVEKVQRPKIASTHDTIAIAGKPTVKIIDQFRRVWNYRGLLFKFKLEAGLDEAALIAVAQKSRVHSAADVIVANTLDMVRGPEPAALIIDNNSVVKVPRAGLAQALCNELAKRLNPDGP